MVADVKAFELQVAHRALLAAVVDDRAERVGDVAVDARIAAESADRFARRGDGVELGVDHTATGAGQQMGQRDGGEHLRAVALGSHSGLGGLFRGRLCDGVERDASHVDECVSAALGQGAPVVLGRRRQCANGFSYQCQPLCVEGALDAAASVEPPRQVELSRLVLFLGFVLGALLVDAAAPRVEHEREVTVGKGPRPPEELGSVSLEGRCSLRSPALGDEPNGGLGDLTVTEGRLEPGQVGEPVDEHDRCTARADRLVGGGGEPVGGRAVAEAGELAVGDGVADLVELRRPCPTGRPCGRAGSRRRAGSAERGDQGVSDRATNLACLDRRSHGSILPRSEA